MGVPQVKIIHHTRVQRARELMRQGRSLDQAAVEIGCTRAELDLSLWRQLGRAFA